MVLLYFLADAPARYHAWDEQKHVHSFYVACTLLDNMVNMYRACTLLDNRMKMYRADFRGKHTNGVVYTFILVWIHITVVN